MEKAEIHKRIIQYMNKYQPERIGVFGSFARNENTSESDIDILVKFKDTISLFDLIRIERELTNLLGIKVDLVTEPSLRNQKLRNYIMNDLRIIYQ